MPELLPVTAAVFPTGELITSFECLMDRLLNAAVAEIVAR